MGSCLFAAFIKKDSENDLFQDYDMGLDEDTLTVFANARIDPIDREKWVGVDVSELSSFRLSGACKDIVREITGETLDREWTSPESVRVLYQSLMEIDIEKAVAEYDGWGPPLEPLEIVELIKFLKPCSECNLGLYNPPWYTD